MYKKKLGKRIIPIDTVVFITVSYRTDNKVPSSCFNRAVKELVYQVIQDIFDEKDLVILEK